MWQSISLNPHSTSPWHAMWHTQVMYCMYGPSANTQETLSRRWQVDGFVRRAWSLSQRTDEGSATARIRQWWSELGRLIFFFLQRSVEFHQWQGCAHLGKSTDISPAQYLISSHLSHSLADRCGTTVDFTTSFLHPNTSVAKLVHGLITPTVLTCFSHCLGKWSATTPENLEPNFLLQADQGTSGWLLRKPRALSASVREHWPTCGRPTSAKFAQAVAQACKIIYPECCETHQPDTLSCLCWLERCDRNIMSCLEGWGLGAGQTSKSHHLSWRDIRQLSKKSIAAFSEEIMNHRISNMWLCHLSLC